MFELSTILQHCHSIQQKRYRCFTYTGTGASSETCNFRLRFPRRKAMVPSCDQSEAALPVPNPVLCFQDSQSKNVIHGLRRGRT